MSMSCPRRITTNNNKDIVVVDRTSPDTGRVVVVGWEGGLRWTYTGHSKINVTTQFNPSSFISELLHTDRSMSLFDVNVMSKI
jgi:hypothetical protein